MVKSRAEKRGEEGLVQAGEIPLAKTLAKKFKPPTRAQIELVDAALAIQSEPDAAERAFIARLHKPALAALPCPASRHAPILPAIYCYSISSL